MLADFFTKAPQGELFLKLRELIMGWKHIYTLHMGLTSTKDFVGNVYKVESIKEVIDSNVDTKDKKWEGRSCKHP